MKNGVRKMVGQNTQTQNQEEKIEFFVYNNIVKVYYTWENFDMIIYFVENVPNAPNVSLSELVDKYTIDSIVVTTVEGVQVMTINRSIKYTYTYKEDGQLVKTPYAEDTSSVVIFTGEGDRTYEISDDIVIETLRLVLNSEISVKDFVEEIAHSILDETEQYIELFLDRVDELYYK